MDNNFFTGVGPACIHCGSALQITEESPGVLRIECPMHKHTLFPGTLSDRLVFFWLQKLVAEKEALKAEKAQK